MTEAIGDGWLKDAFELEKLRSSERHRVPEGRGCLKRANKGAAAYVKAETGLVIDPNTVFDVG